MGILPRLLEASFGIFFGIGPVVLIFILYKLARGKRGDEILINGKEFSRSSLMNFLLLFVLGLGLLAAGKFIFNNFLIPKQPKRDFFEKRYVSRSPEECASIDYSCAPGENLFQDAEGCGCQ